MSDCIGAMVKMRYFCYLITECSDKKFEVGFVYKNCNNFIWIQQGQEAEYLIQNTEQEDRCLATAQPHTLLDIPTTTRSRSSFEDPSSHNTLNPSRTLQLRNPEYVMYTDSELEHGRKEYSDLQRIGQERGCRLSKELHCRLVRNTVTNMVSIMKASSSILTLIVNKTGQDITILCKRSKKDQSLTRR